MDIRKTHTVVVIAMMVILVTEAHAQTNTTERAIRFVRPEMVMHVDSNKLVATHDGQVMVPLRLGGFLLVKYTPSSVTVTDGSQRQA